MKNKHIYLFFFLCSPVYFLQERIISLSSSLSEIVVALGLENEIVGVDITSTYPASLAQKTKLGHISNLSAEGILSLEPNLVLATQMNSQLQEQLKNAKIKVLIFKQEYSLDGTRVLIQSVAQTLKKDQEGQRLLDKFNEQIKTLKLKPIQSKRGIFVYARGIGTMMVAGRKTMITELFSLAGCKNALQDFDDFKPLNAEALVAANPDFFLLFETGLKSMGGVNEFLKVPGVATTQAGKNKRIFAMDGELISSFGLRLPQAIQELNQLLSQKK